MLCFCASYILWVRPLWVGVQFPHIALLCHVLETKNSSHTTNDKKFKLIAPNLLGKFSFYKLELTK
jgi:hypothetical protein